LTLPGLDVHQDFDHVPMNGGWNGEGNGPESAIPPCVQASGVADGGVGGHQPGGEAAAHAEPESWELGAIEGASQSHTVKRAPQRQTMPRLICRASDSGLHDRETLVHERTKLARASFYPV
jgi:hypothetical protein